MGTVYRAESTADSAAGPAGAVVALKVFHPELVADERAFARFRLEAEIGKEIHHEHLVRTYGIGSAEADGQTYRFMVMELIEGQTLKGLLADLGTFPEHLLYQVADQVLGALDEIHGRGVVHRDIKPENIVITPDHRALLMDLGVARREEGRELTQAGEFIGSLSYAAPEQFTAAEVGPRADLYAFGITLFELATGGNPFGDADVGAVMRIKLQEELDPPRSVAPDLDAFWDRVIATCVRRETADRFASAGELRQILREGENSEWWRLQTAGRPVASAEHALRRLRLERRTPLIGRARELARLRAAGARARTAGAVLLLGGPSGVGKSRLLYDYLEEAAGAGGPAVAAGRAVGAGGRGYGPFVEAMGDLLGPGEADSAARRAALTARLTELLPDTPGVVEPLAEFLLGHLQPGPESGLSKDALFAAGVKALHTTAAERPVVLVVEDLHLAGAETVELFAHLARCVPGHAVLLVGVYASDETEEDSPLSELIARAGDNEAAESLVLDNLPAAATEELVRFVVGHEATVRAVAPTLLAKSEGSPLIVLEVLAHLKESELLKEHDDGLDLAGELDEIALPSTVRDLVGLKLAGLDEEQRETLETASVLGAEFEASLLAEVLDEKLIEISKRLAGLERKHRLLASSGKTTFRFARRQLFEAIYDSITPALRTEYHDLVADTLLEATDEPAGESAYALLRHLLLAERALEMAPFLESALDHLAANFHASYAAPLLEKVADEFADAPPPKRLAIAMKLWTFYEFLASREDQMRVLETAREVAEQVGEPGPRAKVHALRAGSYWYASDYDRAAEEAEAGLGLAREAGDRKWEATCHHTLGGVDFRRGDLKACAERWREALARRREIGDRRGEASTLQALSVVLPSIGEGEKVLETMQESLEIWREIGDRRGEAMMLMNLGNHLVDTAQYKEGLRHLQQAIEAHRETGGLINEAVSLINLGRAQDILGRIDDARASWARALQLFRDLQNPNGELATRVQIGGALGRYGEFEEARAHLEASIELAERTGNRTKLLMAHRDLGAVLHEAGDRAQAWVHLEKARVLAEKIKSASTGVLTLAALGKAALREEDYEKAARHLEAALPDARSGDGVEAPLILCRLARAHRGAGREEDARACAREAQERLDASDNVSILNGPEIYYALCLVLEDENLLVLARALVEERARQIRNDSYREHFLTRTWPNAAILAAGDETP
jgi:tetratricopeptide (TPR) repeat protein